MPASRILVATDLQLESDEAIRQALAIAREGHRVAICHVLPETRSVRPLFPQLNDDDALAALEVQDWARAEVDQCLQRLGNPDVDVFFETGVPHLKVIERAVQLKAELIVIASSQSASRTTGTAAGIVRGAPMPVLVARSTLSKGPVLAATDMSDPSVEALKVAARQADALGLEMVALHVVDVEHEMTWLRVVRRVSERASEAFAQRLEALVDDASNRLGKLVAESAPRARVEVRQGDAVDVICKRAAELGAAMIVVATHGRTGVDAALVGSVAEGVVREAASSVLVVRHVG